MPRQSFDKRLTKTAPERLKVKKYLGFVRKIVERDQAEGKQPKRRSMSIVSLFLSSMIAEALVICVRGKHLVTKKLKRDA
ncbi:MAG TPA: hypothetical protein VL129_07605 [Pseudomonas sp.]|jgi:hypothetical protein|uniref:hypothetical protein n=1 Tax=Pseudomonas sp. TaxID=306 RepID=UPI002BF46324|nr:hypothetical protein [Pseudomonas sp.]HTO18991.1 hypothetical protein [Pseudomonas sp.]